MTAAAARESAVENEIVVLDAEPNLFWFGAFRNLNLLVWSRGATMDAYERIERTNPKRTQAHPEKLSTVHIVLPTAGPPEPDAREAFNVMHKQWGHTVGCGALVIERGGFLGVAVRSTIAGMVLVAPKHYRIKVFDNVDHAAPWLSDNHGRSTGAEWSEKDWLAVLKAARTAGLRS
jgi:hypothetical protein